MTAQFTNERLANTLASLGVYFVEGDGQSSDLLSPNELICGLAQSTEARVRLALIPLFLQKPEYHRFVSEIVSHLTDEGKVTLRCYYSAAVLLQAKHSDALASICLDMEGLPRYFDGELNFSADISVDENLRLLSIAHARLSGKNINWLGTYEHAYERLMRHTQTRLQWQ